MNQIKKILRKFFYSFVKFFVPGCIGALIPILVYLFWFKNHHDFIDTSRRYGILDFFYYLFTFFGVIGTYITIFVALFKDSIKEHLFCPEFDITLAEKNGFEEKLSEDASGNLYSTMYYCNLRIRNYGKVVAKQCKVCIDKIYFKDSEKKEFVEISGNALKINDFVSWDMDDTEDIILFPNQERKIELLTLVEKNNKSQIFFCGIDKIQPKYRNKGFWKIDYFLYYGDANKCVKFSLQLDYSGTWQKRKSEMIDKLKIKKL